MPTSYGSIKSYASNVTAGIRPEAVGHPTAYGVDVDNPHRTRARRAHDTRKDTRQFSAAFSQVLLRLGIRIHNGPYNGERLRRDCDLAQRLGDGLSGDAGDLDGAAGASAGAGAGDDVESQRWGDEDARELQELLRKLGPGDANLSSAAWLKPFFRQLRFKRLRICKLDLELERFTRLKYLDVSQNPLTCIDVLPPSLERLKAYNTQICRVECKPLPSLVFFGIGYSPLTNDGLEQAVRRFPGLLALDASYTDVTHLEEAATALAALPRLRQLTLLGSPVGILPLCRLQLLARLPQLQVVGAVINGARVVDAEVADAQRLKLPDSRVRPDIVRVEVQPLSLSNARVLLDVVAKRIAAKRAVAAAVAAGRREKATADASAAAAEVAAAAAANAEEPDPKAKGAKGGGGPGAAEAAEAAEAARVAAEAKEEASTAIADAVKALVLAGRASGEPSAVFARAAGEAAEEAALEAGRTPAEAAKARADTARTAAAPSFAVVSTEPASDKDSILEALTQGFTPAKPCALRLGLQLPGGQAARTSDLALRAEASGDAAAPFDSFDLSQLTSADGGPLSFAVDTSESSMFAAADGEEDRLTRLCAWLRGGLSLQLLFQEAPPPTARELQEAAEAAAAEAAKNAKGGKAPARAASPPPTSAAEEDPDEPPPPAPEEVSAGGAVVSLDAFLAYGRESAAVVADSPDLADVSGRAAPPWEQTLDVKLVPMHRWLEPNVQVPQATSVLKKPWGDLGKPSAAKLRLRVALYAAEPPPPPAEEADGEEG